jgi:hypothetical protein
MAVTVRLRQFLEHLQHTRVAAVEQGRAAARAVMAALAVVEQANLLIMAPLVRLILEAVVVAVDRLPLPASSTKLAAQAALASSFSNTPYPYSLS